MTCLMGKFLMHVLGELKEFSRNFSHLHETAYVGIELRDISSGPLPNRYTY